MTRQPHLLVLLLAAGLTTLPAHATEPLTGCAAKRQELQEKLEMARHHGNSSQVNGLEKALRQLDANCTDEALHEERQAKLEKARQEVQEREHDLREAEAKGDPQKIAKRQAKLAEARAELEQADAAIKR